MNQMDTITPTRKREPLPDLLKGFAILLVVLGHCIQEGSGSAFHENSLYFYDKLYQFIYSFHMPLFMLISGYFAWNSMERAADTPRRYRLLGRKALSLLLPVFSCALFEQLWTFAENGWRHPALTSFSSFAKAFALKFLSTGWFLWAVFWCFLIVYILHFYLRDSILLYGIGFLVMFVVPDGLGLGAYKYMFPYFIAGFYFHRYRMQSASDHTTPGWGGWLWMTACGFLFVILFLFFDENSMIYLSGYKCIGKDIPRQLKIDLYRMLIGFSGSCFFLLFWKRLLSLTRYSFPLLRALGRNSLGIYLISGEICLIAGQKLRSLLYPDYLLNLAEMAVVIVLSCLFTVILGKLPLLHWLVGQKH